MRSEAAAMLAILVIVACAVPSHATYSVSASSFSQGTGRASAGQYDIVFTIGQVSPTGSGESGVYTLVSGVVPALADVAPPEIIHAPQLLAARGSAVRIKAYIVDTVTGVDSVLLCYREGGMASFTSMRMEPAEQDTFSAEIPAAAVTERGLCYYIQAVDEMGNRSTSPQGAPDSLTSLHVYFPVLAADIDLPAGQYRMVSLPGTPTDGGADSVLFDDFGGYDKTVWRLGRWNESDNCTTQCYDEYPDLLDFAPGRAYWLIHGSGRGFDFGGISTDVTRPYAVHLDLGWNQIGNPYAFATDWQSGFILFAGQQYSIGTAHEVDGDTIYVENNLIAYDGEYQPSQSTLYPWDGYWLFNAGTEEVDIAFPPEMVQGARMQAASLGNGLNALVTVRTATPETGQGVCYAGLAENAEDSWDSHDLHAPPTIDDGVRAVFRHEGWGRLSGDYMLDTRNPSGDGETWRITAESKGQTHAGISVTLSAGLPDDWAVVLYDMSRGVKITDFSRPYNARVDGRTEFELAMGTLEYLAGEEAGSGIELRTQIVSVSPNPFVDMAEVAFHMGSRQRVSINIYNILGALVAEVVDTVLEPGMHSLIWHGDTSAGANAAPGIYFLMMRTQDGPHTSKIIKLR